MCYLIPFSVNDYWSYVIKILKKSHNNRIQFKLFLQKSEFDQSFRNKKKKSKKKFKRKTRKISHFQLVFFFNIKGITN